MMESIPDDIRVKIVKAQLSDPAIECLIRVYRWTKSERYPVFFKHILKRIHNYQKGLNRLKQKGFVYVIKSRDPWRITEDGMRVGGLLLELRNKGLL
jgi:hypothetical protein